MVPFTFSSSLFVYRPHFKIPVSYDGIFQRNLPGYSQNEPDMIGHRTTEGKLLRNLQDRVTMETRPCEVLLRSHPLQSPWRLWQRTEYSNLAWLFTMATLAEHFGDNPGAISMETCWGCLQRLHQSHLWVVCYMQTQQSNL